MKKEFKSIKSKLKFLICGLICLTSNICGDPDNEAEGKGRMTKVLELPRNVRELEREINRAKSSMVTQKDLEKITTKSEVDGALENTLNYDPKTGAVQFEIGEDGDKKTIKLPYKGSADTKINYSMLQEFLNRNDVELNAEVTFGTKSINDIIKNILINPETVYIIGNPAEPTQKMSIKDFVKKVLLDPTTEYGYETNKKATLAVLSNELLEKTIKEMLDSMDAAMPITLNKDTMLFVPMDSNTFTANDKAVGVKNTKTADASINLVDELVAIRNFADTCEELKPDKWGKAKMNREMYRLRELLRTFNYIENESGTVERDKRILFDSDITDNFIGILKYDEDMTDPEHTKKDGKNKNILDEMAGVENFITTPEAKDKIFFWRCKEESPGKELWFLKIHSVLSPPDNAKIDAFTYKHVTWDDGRGPGYDFSLAT